MKTRILTKQLKYSSERLSVLISLSNIQTKSAHLKLIHTSVLRSAVNTSKINCLFQLVEGYEAGWPN